jgi:Na+/pantothenate symporter
MKLTKISILSIKLLKIHVIPKLARVEVVVVASMIKAFPTALFALQLEVPMISAASNVLGLITRVESSVEATTVARVQHMKVPTSSAIVQL